MTDLARYAASNPLNELPLPCLEISHPDWEAPHRRVRQPGDWTVIVNGVDTLFPGWNTVGPWLGAYASSDDTGRAGRILVLDDAFNELTKQIVSVRERNEPVIVRIWLFKSNKLDQPMIRELYKMQRILPGDQQLRLECVSRNLSLITDPYIRHTRTNSPGLRGR